MCLCGRWKCTHCNNYSVLKSRDMEDHVRVKHNEQPWLCPSCPASYSWRQDLRKLLKTCRQLPGQFRKKFSYFFDMNGENGIKECIWTGRESTVEGGRSVSQAQTENEKMEGKVEGCENSIEAHPELQTQHNIADGRRGETVRRRPHGDCPTPSAQTSKIGTGPGQSDIQPHEGSKGSDCYAHACPRNSCFHDADVLPIKYPSLGKPCVPEYVQPCPPSDGNRRPRLPEAPEMLCTLKQGIRHPFQISQRRKEMQTHLDKLTDEHEAFAFPPGTRVFVDDAYYATESASSRVENYDIVRRDVDMGEFAECTIRPYLLAFNRDKYKFFRERLPMSQKRILDIPSNRILHWHNWVVRSLRTQYSESWRKDIKVPENWFGPEIKATC